MLLFWFLCEHLDFTASLNLKLDFDNKNILQSFSNNCNIHTGATVFLTPRSYRVKKKFSSYTFFLHY